MQRFLIALLSLTFAFQPAMAGAASLATIRAARTTVTVRPAAAHVPRLHSARATRQNYDAGNKKRAARHVPAPKQAAATYAPIGDIIPALPAGGLSIGDQHAPVTIVEFGDYECPFCAQFQTDTFPTIKKRYVDAGRVRFVFRNYPLVFHSEAFPAAEAVECARDQSDALAWKLLDAIFALSNDGKLTDNTLDIAIRSVDTLKAADVTACMHANQKESLIQQDVKDANAGGVNGTPSFWILGPNGKAELMQGAQEYESFRMVLDGMLK